MIDYLDLLLDFSYGILHSLRCSTGICIHILCSLPSLRVENMSHAAAATIITTTATIITTTTLYLLNILQFIENFHLL